MFGAILWSLRDRCREEGKQDSYNQCVYSRSIPRTKKLSVVKSILVSIRDRSRQICRITKKHTHTHTFKNTKYEKQCVYCILRSFYVELYIYCVCVVLQSYPRLSLFFTGSRRLPEGGGLLAARFTRVHASTSPITTRLRPNAFKKQVPYITRLATRL